MRRINFKEISCTWTRSGARMQRSAFCYAPTTLQVLVRHCTRAPRSRWVCSISNNSNSEKRIVFMGTPDVAAASLRKLVERAPEVGGRVVGVVTRPPASKGRTRTLTPSPVHTAALEWGIDSADIYVPATARREDFIRAMADIAPDLMVTAAYGCILPQALLDIPIHGTLNIHPSLLPRWRGAAPVPRAIEHGDAMGVSVCKTVYALDAGPILAQRRYVAHENATAPAVLAHLFDLGTDLLLENLPAVWDHSASYHEQDHSLATHAAKLAKSDARLTFVENAVHVHNKVRAYCGWPGTWADFEVIMDTTVEKNTIRLKVVTTIVLREQGGMCLGVHDVSFDNEHQCLRVICDDGSVIGILEVQPPGKKVMSARAYWNGLRNKKLGRKRIPH